MIRLAFSTNAYLRYTFEEASSRIAKIGYEGLELMADVPHAWPAGLLEGPKRGSARRWSKSGLAFSNVNAFMMNAIDDRRQPYWYPSFIDPEPNYRQVRIDHTRRALDLCAELGAPHITTEPGGPFAEGRGRQEGDRPVRRGPEAARRACPRARSLAPDRARAGLAPGDDGPVSRSGRATQCPVDRLEFRRRPRLLRERRHPPRRSPSWHPRSATITSKTSRPSGSTITSSPARGRSTSRRCSGAIERTGYEGWVTVELYPFVDDPDARRPAGLPGAPPAGRDGPDVA